VNSTRWAVFENLKQTGLPVTTGTGGRTQYNRTRMGVPKSHWLDAVCVGEVEQLVILTQKMGYKPRPSRTAFLGF